MSVYADSSFLVSLYMTDVHSTEARSRAQHSMQLLLTPLHLAEWAHAIGQHQFRGTLNTQAAQELRNQFASDRANGLWHELALPDRAFALCEELAHRHASQIGMRALDTLHVACALELKAERFWTFDERQKTLAVAQGLKTR